MTSLKISDNSNGCSLRSYDFKMVDKMNVALVSLFVFTAVLAENGPVPVVIWHGMGNVSLVSSLIVPFMCKLNTVVYCHVDQRSPNRPVKIH